MVKLLVLVCGVFSVRKYFFPLLRGSKFGALFSSIIYLFSEHVQVLCILNKSDQNNRKYVHKPLHLRG